MRRIKQIFEKENISLFDGEIKSDQISQSESIFDNLLTAIAIASEKPYLIKRLFEVVDINPEGIYSI